MSDFARLLIEICVVGSLGLLTILSFFALLKVLRQEDVDIGVRGRWAGFGGGRAGWRLSPALGLLFLTVFFGLTFAIASTYGLGLLRQDTACCKKLDDLEKQKAGGAAIAAPVATPQAPVPAPSSGPVPAVTTPKTTPRQ